MKRAFSWWFVDQKRNALVNPSTGQQVRFVRRIIAPELDLPASPHRYWMRFEYEDQDCRYPLLVEWRPDVGGSLGANTTCRVDHVRSAKLWAHEGGSGAGHPPFGLWKRVHVATADAFSCWPPMDAVGPAPGQVWIVGGWCNGVWTDTFYQVLTAGTAAILKRLSAWVPPLDAPAPSPWIFVDKTDAQPNVIRSWLSRITGKSADLAALETALIWSLPEGLPDPGYCGPHLRTGDGTRALIPVEFLSPEADLEKGIVRLRVLYIDQDLICDCLTLSNDRRTRLWQSSFDHPISRIESGGIAARHSRLALQDQPIEISERRTLFWADTETVIPRTPLWHRLADAVTEAWLEWRDTILVLPQRSSGKRARVNVPGANCVTLPNIAHQGAILSGKIAKTLAPQFPAGQPTVLDDAPAVYAAPVRRDVGWWSFDEESRSIRNAASNQCVRLVETETEAAWHSSDWWFQYTDAEVEYPIFVRRRLSLAGGHGTWEIDHERSAEKWRARVNGNLPHPSFGLWRRVNDAVVDALFCWRELDRMMLNVAIRSGGGWWNGNWRNDCVTNQSGSRVPLEKPDGKPAEPILEPLLGNAPPKWMLVANPINVVRLELAHVVHESGGAAFLPAEAALEGFQERSSYLRRSDGSAVLFPAYASRRWQYDPRESGEFYKGTGYFLYANENEFLTCAYDNGFLTFQIESPGGRTAAAASRFAANSEHGVLAMAENYSAWRRLSLDLRHALPLWRGGGRRLLEGPEQFANLRQEKLSERFMPKWEESGISLDLPQPVPVIGGYVGGFYTRNLAITTSVPEK